MDCTKVINNLRKNGFAVSFFDTPEAAAEYLVSEIRGTSVGIGGSVTIGDMELYEKLSENNTVFHHWHGTPAEIFPKASNAAVYLTSANAISETGEIVNIDGIGNRVASTLFGHEKVYIIAGTNKIAPTLDDAMHRARNVAAPLNAKRLNKNTPCAKTLTCHDCSSPDRICSGIVILAGKMGGISHMEVVLIDCELGL